MKVRRPDKLAGAPPVLEAPKKRTRAKKPPVDAIAGLELPKKRSRPKKPPEDATAEAPKKKPRAKKRSKTYCVYVIELKSSVWKERAKMKAANRRFNPLTSKKQCVYVGMTVYTPEKRFLVHLDGGRNSANVVRRFGKHLRPDLYESYGRMSLKDAEEMERYLAARLRRKGYAVWPVAEGGALGGLKKPATKSEAERPNPGSRRPRHSRRGSALRSQTVTLDAGGRQ